MADSMVTSRDVARLAGVSQATVSRAMNPDLPVRDSTRARVLDAIRRTNYSPNRVARAMRTGRVGAVGIVVADLENPFYPHMLDALSTAFGERDYRVNVWIASSSANDAALEAIRERSVDGVVFTTATEDSSELASALERGSPVTLVNRALPGVECDQVSTDNRAGAAMVADYLLAHGRKRCAFIGGTPNATTSRARLAGFAERLAASGCALDPDLVLGGDYSYDSGYARTLALLDGGAERFDAVFCSNDVLALGAMDAARARGVRVPDDVWVVGYDDIDMAGWGAYSLTTVRQDIPAIAGLAAELLIGRIEGSHRPWVQAEFAPRLVVRASTANAPS